MKIATFARIAIVATLTFVAWRFSPARAAGAPGAVPTVGGMSPKHVVQAASGAQAISPAQKLPAVILFWASWCAPCVENLPAYNRLVDKFTPAGVTFVAVSPESIDSVAAFLKRVPIKGWVLADPEGLLTAALSVKVYPTTLVVTPTETTVLRVAGETVPEGVLAAAASGRPVMVPLPPRPTAGTSSTADDRDVVRARLSITPPSAESPVTAKMSIERSWFRATGVTLSALIEEAFGVPAWQVEWEVLQPTERFDAVVEVPGDETARWKGVLRDLVTHGLGLAATREKRSATSYALMGTTERLTRSSEIEGESKFVRRSGTLDGTNIDLDGLSVVLGQILHAPFGNTMTSKQRYNIHLEWAPDQEESLFPALERIGLRVESFNRVEERVVVRAASCGD